MREIRFKGYAKEELVGSQWVTNGYGIAEIKYTDDTPTDYILLTPYGNYSVYEESISQYTGCKDRYGNEIWENDIISYDKRFDSVHYNAKKIIEIEGVVKYASNSFVICSKDDQDIILEKEFKDCRVIGSSFSK